MQRTHAQTCLVMGSAPLPQRQQVQPQHQSRQRQRAASIHFPRSLNQQHPQGHTQLKHLLPPPSNAKQPHKSPSSSTHTSSSSSSTPSSSTSPTPSQSSETTRSEQRRLRLLEIESEIAAEEAEAIKMTDEQHETLMGSFVSVKIEFSDLDGKSWTKAALRTFQTQNKTRPNPSGNGCIVKSRTRNAHTVNFNAHTATTQTITAHIVNPRTSTLSLNAASNLVLNSNPESRVLNANSRVVNSSSDAHSCSRILPSSVSSSSYLSSTGTLNRKRENSISLESSRKPVKGGCKALGSTTSPITILDSGTSTMDNLDLTRSMDGSVDSSVDVLVDSTSTMNESSLLTSTSTTSSTISAAPSASSTPSTDSPSTSATSLPSTNSPPTTDSVPTPSTPVFALSVCTDNLEITHSCPASPCLSSYSEVTVRGDEGTKVRDGMESEWGSDIVMNIQQRDDDGESKAASERLEGWLAEIRGVREGEKEKSEKKGYTGTTFGMEGGKEKDGREKVYRKSGRESVIGKERERERDSKEKEDQRVPTVANGKPKPKKTTTITKNLKTTSRDQLLDSEGLIDVWSMPGCSSVRPSMVGPLKSGVPKPSKSAVPKPSVTAPTQSLIPSFNMSTFGAPGKTKRGLHRTCSMTDVWEGVARLNAGREVVMDKGKGNVGDERTGRENEIIRAGDVKSRSQACFSTGSMFSNSSSMFSTTSSFLSTYSPHGSSTSYSSSIPPTSSSPQVSFSATITDSSSSLNSHPSITSRPPLISHIPVYVSPSSTLNQSASRLTSIPTSYSSSTHPSSTLQASSPAHICSTTKQHLSNPHQFKPPKSPMISPTVLSQSGEVLVRSVGINIGDDDDVPVVSIAELRGYSMGDNSVDGYGSVHGYEHEGRYGDEEEDDDDDVEIRIFVHDTSGSAGAAGSDDATDVTTANNADDDLNTNTTDMCCITYLNTTAISQDTNEFDSRVNDDSSARVDGGLDSRDHAEPGFDAENAMVNVGVDVDVDVGVNTKLERELDLSLNLDFEDEDLDSGDVEGGVGG